MKYMLDTNICIFAIKHSTDKLIDRITSHNADDLCISSITYAELMHGVEKSTAVARNRIALMLFLTHITILSFDDAAAEAYGIVRAALETAGTPIGPLDNLIAGHALSQKLVLVTNNTREFLRVPGLDVEDWSN